MLRVRALVQLHQYVAAHLNGNARATSHLNANVILPFHLVPNVIFVSLHSKSGCVELFVGVAER